MPARKQDGYEDKSKAGPGSQMSLSSLGSGGPAGAMGELWDVSLIEYLPKINANIHPHKDLDGFPRWH